MFETQGCVCEPASAVQPPSLESKNKAASALPEESVGDSDALLRTVHGCQCTKVGKIRDGLIFVRHTGEHQETRGRDRAEGMAPANTPFYIVQLSNHVRTQTFKF